MRALSVRLEDALGSQFDRLCHDMGYKKNTLISRLIQAFVFSQSQDSPALQKKRKKKDPFLDAIGLINVKPTLSSSDEIDQLLYNL